MSPEIIPAGANEIRLTIRGDHFGRRATVFVAGTEVRPLAATTTELVIVVGGVFRPGVLSIRVSDPCDGVSNIIVIQIRG